MRFYNVKHQDKGATLVRTLNVQEGWAATSTPSDADFLFIDSDFGTVRRALVKEFVEAKKPVLLYPHAARPSILWDGIVPMTQHTAHFVPSIGHIDVMRAYGYPYPIHTTGWHLSEIKPFTPTGGRAVLFAPIHPNYNGFLSPRERKANARTYTLLIRLHKRGLIDLKVRHLHALKYNGLWEEDGVEYVSGRDRLRDSLLDVEEADCVVGHQTLAYQAIALGKPTIMMDERAVPVSGNKRFRVKRVKSWKKYRDLLQYPLDILAGYDAYSLIQHACDTDVDIRDWRARFIGEPYMPDKFITDLKGYVETANG